MAERIKPLTREEAPEAAREFYDQDERAFGVVLNPTRVMARRPTILAAGRALSRSVSTEATLPAELRALMCIHIATLVGCPF